MMKTFSRWAVKPWLLRAGALMTLAMPLTACDGLLEVEDPDTITPGQLEGEAGIPLRVAGTLSDFTVGYSGSSLTEGLVPASGMFTDEVYLSGTFPTRIEIDTRRINRLSNTQILNPYRSLHRARVQAIALAELAAEFDEPNSPNLALGRNIEGYTEVLLAEHFCSGVPFSDEEGVEIVFGEPLTTRAIFENALSRFDAVIAANPSSATQLNLARVGRGRALLNLGRYADAAAAVAAVPTNFVFRVQHSENTPAQNNAYYALSENGRFSVANNEGTGGNTLPFRSDSLDVRIRAYRATRIVDGVAVPRLGFDNATPLFMTRLYNDEGDDVPLASGVEARLIEIEALLNQGASNAYLAPLNALRASFQHPNANVGMASLPPLTDPGTPAGRVDQFFKERAYFLYLTAHRLGDLRRLMRQYGREQDEVFPTGAYHKQGRTYGTQTAFPIPFAETNNPNFTDCLPSEGF